MGNSLQAPKESANPTQELEQQQFTCEICIEPISATHKFKNKNLCTHPFCLDCIAKYIEVKIVDNTANIECPSLNCPHNLDPISCTPFIPKPLFSKWCDLLCDNSVLGIDKCYCPNRNCMELVVNECRGTVKKAKCPNCKEVFCFQCRKVWHAGFRCEESEAMTSDRNDVLFGRLMENKNWKRCPGCGHCVELRIGCPVVKCRCKTRFCYNCGRNFLEHVNGCDNHGEDFDVFSFALTVAVIMTLLLFFVSLMRNIDTNVDVPS